MGLHGNMHALEPPLEDWNTFVNEKRLLPPKEVDQMPVKPETPAAK